MNWPCYILASLPLLLAGCGYHVAGRADLMPKSIHTIAIPAFGNATTRYKLSDRLTAAVAREFIARTRYQVVADPNAADAILSGAVVNFSAYPTVFDPASSRATSVQTNVTVQVKLTNRATGAVLFNQPGMEFHERYEISVDPRAYFDESDAAMDRLSRDVARWLVSSILENF